MIGTGNTDGRVSQLPTEEWVRELGDNTSRCDPLTGWMHNAHRLSPKGESMRKRRSELTQSEHFRVRNGRRERVKDQGVHVGRKWLFNFAGNTQLNPERSGTRAKQAA